MYKNMYICSENESRIRNYLLNLSTSFSLDETTRKLMSYASDAETGGMMRETG